MTKLTSHSEQQPAAVNSQEALANKVKSDAKGQFAKPNTAPNERGLISANPAVFTGDGDATFAGHPHEGKANPEGDQP